MTCIGLMFIKDKNKPGSQLQVPCGQCMGCRLEKARQWAVRCVHEAQMYKNNCFITLTYNDDNLPKSKSIDKKTVSDFMRKLRRKVKQKDIRFMASGEYGTTCKN